MTKHDWWEVSHVTGITHFTWFEKRFIEFVHSLDRWFK